MSRLFTGAQNAFYAIPSYTVSAISAVIGRASSAAGVQPPAKAKAEPRVKGKARPEAKPYQEGKSGKYSIRTQRNGHGIYLSGYATEDGVQEAARERRKEIDKQNIPKGRGPNLTTAAQAMQDYAMARLRFKKGAVQEAVRLNHYLRAARLETLLVTPLAAAAPALPATKDAVTQPAKASKPEKRSTVYFAVTLQPFQDGRNIAKGLHAHRKAQLTKTAGSRQYRDVLATKAMGKMTRDDMQGYMDAMRDEGAAPATMKLEQALWRGLFNYAFTKWSWTSLKDNPATRLDMPAVNNERKRMMSLDEQTLLDTALLDCRNSLVAPVLTLLRETAMRVSEPLAHARWRDVDWTRRVLCLSDGKAGKRDVPLSPVAIQVLRDLGPGLPDQRIVCISYDALKKGMERACKRAGIKNLHIHDLRRTGATRLALKTGNLFLVKALTGHKTDAMAARYMQVGADDVVSVMHAPEPAPVATPVGGAIMPTPSQQGMAEAAMQPTFTMEQMQAMAQLAARAAVDSLRSAEPAAEHSIPQLTPRPVAPELTLVQTPARRTV